MKKKPADNLIKNPVIATFQQKCFQCPYQSTCVRGSNLSLNSENYWKAVHNKQIFTKEDIARMNAGSRWHEEITSDYKTIDEYGIDNFLQDFNEGKEISLRELKVCNLNGRRGTIDLIRFRKFRKKITIDIVELKSGFKRENIDQLNSYASLFTNSNAEIIYKTKKKTKGIPFRGIKFIPEDSIVYIRTLLISKRFGKIHQNIWMRDNILTESGRIGEMLLQKKLKNYRRLHKMAIYKPIEQKNVQRFIGRRKWIIKSHPVFRTVNLHESIAN